MRLERNKEDSQTRAVKRIAMVSNSFSDSECVKELRAMLEFSKPKVSRSKCCPALALVLTLHSSEKQQSS